jgi:hypothetical protein
MGHAPNAAVRFASGPLHGLRRTGDDIEARPDLYADMLASEPTVRDLVDEFVRSWRTASSAIALFGLMARRPAPVTFDVLAFLRLVGRDIGANPAPWADLVQAQPRFADDCARLTQTLRNALQTNTPTAYA